MVSRLIATQLENGYMGTYTEENRFVKMLENEKNGEVGMFGLTDTIYTTF